jgi:hypothetical protein
MNFEYLPCFHLLIEKMHSFGSKRADHFVVGLQAGSLTNVGEFFDVSQ